MLSLCINSQIPLLNHTQTQIYTYLWRRLALAQAAVAGRTADRAHRIAGWLWAAAQRRGARDGRAQRHRVGAVAQRRDLHVFEHLYVEQRYGWSIWLDLLFMKGTLKSYLRNIYNGMCVPRNNPNVYNHHRLWATSFRGSFPVGILTSIIWEHS